MDIATLTVTIRVVGYVFELRRPPRLFWLHMLPEVPSAIAVSFDGGRRQIVRVVS